MSGLWGKVRGKDQSVGRVRIIIWGQKRIVLKEGGGSAGDSHRHRERRAVVLVRYDEKMAFLISDGLGDGLTQETISGPSSTVSQRGGGSCARVTGIEAVNQ